MLIPLAPAERAVLAVVSLLFICLAHHQTLGNGKEGPRVGYDCIFYVTPTIWNGTFVLIAWSEGWMENITSLGNFSAQLFFFSFIPANGKFRTRLGRLFSFFHHARPVDRLENDVTALQRSETKN